jgi:ubiquinol-cytochrome c reductase cytochrome c subunit
MKKFSMLAAVAAGALLLGAFLSAQTVSAQATGSAARGKTAFMHYGCWECHGTLGTGNLFSGPAIAPHPIPYQYFLTYIRAPRGQMPPFDEHVLPASDAQDIWAYLNSIPANPAPSTVHAVQSIDTGNAGAPPPVSAAAASGRELYTAYCIKCHAYAPIGPSLVNEKARKNLEQTIAQIKNPVGPMPKLYPQPLSDKDVSDIAAYVQTL